MADCGCGGGSQRTVVWRVERSGETPREFATAKDAQDWDNAQGGGGDVFPVSK